MGILLTQTGANDTIKNKKTVLLSTKYILYKEYAYESKRNKIFEFRK